MDASNLQRATHVTIDGERYKLGGLLYSPARGAEIQCMNANGTVARVCWFSSAVRHDTKVRASGDLLHFTAEQ